MRKIVKIVAMLFCGLLMAACVPDKGFREEFEMSVKGYNRMLRWQEVAGAGQLYMEPEGREKYMATAESMKKRGVTITDFRILTMEFLPERDRGDVLVEFDYYALPSNRIKTLTYRQDWVYRKMDDAKGWQGKSWRVKSALPPFD